MTKGLHTHRFADNPEEERIAKAWAEHNAQGKTLAYLLCEGDQRFPPEPADREQEVAATVIQWLGSPVGRSFLRDLGYRRAEVGQEAKDDSPDEPAYGCARHGAPGCCCEDRP